MKRFAIALLLLVAATTAFVFLRPQSPRAVMLNKSTGVGGQWPLDQAWTWSYPVPAQTRKDPFIALRLREKVVPIPPHTSPAIGRNVAPLTHSQADRQFGPGMVGVAPHVRTGDVTIQLIDLDRVGAASDKPGRNLRVISRLSAGGATAELAGDNIYLPAGRIAGTALSDSAEWVGDELFLGSFYVEGDGQLHRYDVVLEQTAL